MVRMSIGLLAANGAGRSPVSSTTRHGHTDKHHHALCHPNPCAWHRPQPLGLHSQVSNRCIQVISKCMSPSTQTQTVTTQSSQAETIVPPPQTAATQYPQQQLQQQQQNISTAPQNNPAVPANASASTATTELMARTYDLCLALGITRPSAFRLCSSQPDIPVPTLAAQMSERAKLLSIQVEEVALLHSKEPRLMNTSIDQLTDTLVCLCDLLGGITRTEASQVVVYSPALLTLHKEQLTQQYDNLQEVLQVSKQQLSELVYKQPYMLTTPIQKVQKQLVGIADLLRLSLPQAVQLMAAYPPLTLEKPARLRDRLDHLCSVLTADIQQVINMIAMYPPILMTHPDITVARLQLLADNLNITRDSLAPLLLTNPAMFSTPQNVLTAQFNKLFTYFNGQSKAEILTLVAENPTLLGLGVSNQLSLEQQQQHQ